MPWLDRSQQKCQRVRILRNSSTSGFPVRFSELYEIYGPRNPGSRCTIERRLESPRNGFFEATILVDDGKAHDTPQYVAAFLGHPKVAEL
jgi:hypothetical protein